mgnify:CR=1 FL=1
MWREPWWVRSTRGAPVSWFGQRCSGLTWIRSLCWTAKGFPNGDEQLHKRMREVADKWRWQHDGGSRFDTRDGLLDLAWDGTATIKAAARRGWERALWSAEPRAREERTVALQNGPTLA